MKLGFACKFLDSGLKQEFPFKSTTRTRFLSLDHAPRLALLSQLAQTNLNNLYLTLEQLAQLPPALRMMRIGSDLLPLYTVPEAGPVYQEFFAGLAPLFASPFIPASIRF
ncbi:UV damage repair endonuclease [Cronobacter turicensis 564]|nr:UV damage repair endonuclease [Cronobacter turicensis 564]